MANRFTNAALAGLLSGVVACAGGEDLAKKNADDALHAAEQAKENAKDATHAAAKAVDQVKAFAGNTCAGQNACKGLGGCKTEANSCKGQNDCKGKGGCHISAEDQAKLAAAMVASGTAQVALEQPTTTFTGNACAGHNECKGMGGCKTEANTCKGQNDCKGKGGCKLTGEEQAKLAAAKAH